MQVLKAVDPRTATGKTRELFEVVENTLKSAADARRIAYPVEQM